MAGLFNKSFGLLDFSSSEESLSAYGSFALIPESSVCSAEQFARKLARHPDIRAYTSNKDKAEHVKYLWAIERLGE